MTISTDLAAARDEARRIVADAQSGDADALRRRLEDLAALERPISPAREALVSACRAAASILTRRDRAEDAAMFLDQALLWDPRDLNARLHRAGHDVGQRLWTRCLEDLAIALDVDPANERALGLLALIPQSAARDDLARTAARDARARAQDAPALAPAALRICTRAAQADLAAELVAGMRPLDALSTDGLAAIAEFARSTHDIGLMDETYRLWRAREPQALAVHELGLDLSFNQGAERNVEPLFRRILANADRRAADRWLLLNACLALGRPSEAAAILFDDSRYPRVREAIPNLAPFDAPISVVDGKRVLFIGFTEIGDEIRLLELLDRAARRAGACSLAIDARLAPLAARGRPDVEIIPVTYAQAAGDAAVPIALRPLVDGDLFARLGSFDVVVLLRQTEAWIASDADLPSERRTLRPDPARQAHWRAWIASLGDGPKVGLFWRSSRTNYRRLNRGTTLADWAPLLGLPHLHVVCLQFGDGVANEIAALPTGLAARLAVPPGLDLKDDFEGQAALIAGLDLVVTVPGTAQHLAGAVGAQTLAVTHPSQRLWRARPKSSVGMWSPRVHVVCGPPKDGFQGGIDAVARRLASWRRNGEQETAT